VLLLQESCQLFQPLHAFAPSMTNKYWRSVGRPAPHGPRRNGPAAEEVTLAAAQAAREPENRTTPPFCAICAAITSGPSALTF
jgi:hypothetical protein